MKKGNGFVGFCLYVQVERPDVALLLGVPIANS